MLIAAGGGFLALSGNLIQLAGNEGEALDQEDALGLGIGCGFVLLLSSYMVFIQTIKMELTKEALFCLQAFTSFTVCFTISMNIDDW